MRIQRETEMERLANENKETKWDQEANAAAGLARIQTVKRCSQDGNPNTFTGCNHWEKLAFSCSSRNNMNSCQIIEFIKYLYIFLMCFKFCFLQIKFNFSVFLTKFRFLLRNILPTFVSGLFQGIYQMIQPPAESQLISEI